MTLWQLVRLAFYGVLIVVGLTALAVLLSVAFK